MNSAYRIELAPLVQHILATLPETQAIYLFGSYKVFCCLVKPVSHQARSG